MRFVGVVLLLSWAFGSLQASSFRSYSGQTMGTQYLIKTNHSLDQGKIDLLLQKLNDQVSTYIVGSEIDKFAKAKQNESVVISQDFYNIAVYSLGLAKKTNGYFDPTIGPLVRLWGFGPRSGPQKKPSPQQVAELKKAIGYDKVEITQDSEKYRIKKSHKHTELDLSATAKGYGVDLIYAYLLSEAHTDFMIEIGGEVRVYGLSPSRKSWAIGIESPDVDMRSIKKILALPPTKALATSGDYRNFFSEGGQHFSHTIDPKTGSPVQHPLTSVSVIADNCMQADGLATALLVMGYAEAKKFASAHKLSVLLMQRQGDKVELYESEWFTNTQQTAKGG